MEKPLVIFATAATASNKTAEENLGLAYLAAVCRKNNFEVEIIDGWLEDLSIEEVEKRILSKRKPLFVGFSCNQLNGSTAIEIVNSLKSKDYCVPFVAGGFAPTFNPEKFLNSGFDIVSIGEGEKTTLDLCNHFHTGKPNFEDIPSICYYNEKKLQFHKANIIQNLDTLPFPSRDTISYVINEKTPVNISTSRGCMSSCLFCSVSAFWNLCNAPKWRGRSVQNIVDEIEELYNLGARHIKFVDDSFIESPRDEKWCNELANEINKRNLDIKLRITLKADKITDGIINALCNAGCNLFACGIENFSDTALKRMGKKANSLQNKTALDILRKYNVYVQMGYILFDYGTTMSELRENYEMMKKYSWTICRGIFSEMYAARGTAYTKMLKKKGVIECVHLENYDYKICDKKVRMMYHALKKWHISHMRMYNMVIEPINKPKVLCDKGLEEFYQVYLQVRKQDLTFMGQALNLVENNVTEIQLDEFIKKSIKNCEQWFKLYEEKIYELYKQEKITYTAEDDPFTC